MKSLILPLLLIVGLTVANHCYAQYPISAKGNGYTFYLLEDGKWVELFDSEVKGFPITVKDESNNSYQILKEGLWKETGGADYMAKDEFIRKCISSLRGQTVIGTSNSTFDPKCDRTYKMPTKFEFSNSSVSYRLKQRDVEGYTHETRTSCEYQKLGDWYWKSYNHGIASSPDPSPAGVLYTIMKGDNDFFKHEIGSNKAVYGSGLERIELILNDKFQIIEAIYSTRSSDYIQSFTYE
ncbi:hypothetical protein [Ekhidna sp.]|uniref:hypothetical protein n=1 Tax=Ekhidna sp. TaxID=2608089 RepID=UPI003B5BF12F